MQKTLNDFATFSKDYIAGIIDGEGCFNLSTINNTVHMSFTFNMRIDAYPALQIINRTIGNLGKFTFVDVEYDYSKKGKNAPRNNRKIVVMHIGKYENMKKFAEWLKDCPLFLKKKEYEVWKEALFFYDKHRKGSGKGKRISKWVLYKMREYEEKLKALKHIYEKRENNHNKVSILTFQD